MSEFAPANPDYSGYVCEGLRQANNEFGNCCWALVELDKDEVLKIRLPAHTDAKLPAGTVQAAMERFRANPEQFQCRELIARMASDTSPVYLKQSGDGDLEHIDGLHRLIAAGLSGREPVIAYLAGNF